MSDAPREKTSEDQDAAQLQRNKARDLAALGDAFRDVRQGRSIFETARPVDEHAERNKALGPAAAALVLFCNDCRFETEDPNIMLAHARRHGWAVLVYTGRGLK